MANTTSTAPITGALEIHVTGRRVLATIADGIALGVLFWVMSALFGTTSSSSATEEHLPHVGASLDGFSALIFFVLVFAYYVILEGYLGQSLGKMLFGIKVVREDTGGVPGIGAAAIRTVLRIVDGLFSYLVAFIAVLASSKNQRLGDMAAHTLVVRK